MEQGKERISSFLPVDLRVKLTFKVLCCIARCQGSSALWVITVIMYNDSLLSWDTGKIRL